MFPYPFEVRTASPRVDCPGRFCQSLFPSPGGRGEGSGSRPDYKDKKRKTGIEAKPNPMIKLNTVPKRSTAGMYLGWLSPSV
jgi:hypothetical protein